MEVDSKSHLTLKMTLRNNVLNYNLLSWELKCSVKTVMNQHVLFVNAEAILVWKCQKYNKQRLLLLKDLNTIEFSHTKTTGKMLN